MPFVNETFDFIIISAVVFINFADPIGALPEKHQVLRTHRKVAIIDMRRDASDAALCDFVKSMGLGRTGFAYDELDFQVS